MNKLIFALMAAFSLIALSSSVTAQCCGGGVTQFSLGLSGQHMVLGIDVNELAQKETSVNGQLIMAELDTRFSFVSLNLKGGIAPNTIGQQGALEIENFFSTQGTVNLNVLPCTSDFNLSVGGGIHYDGGKVNNLLNGEKATVRTIATVLQAGFDITVAEFFLISAQVGFGQYADDKSIDLFPQGNRKDRKMYGGVSILYMFP